MQRAFKNIIELLKESSYTASILGSTCEYVNLGKAIEIVKQEAEEFATDTNVGTNGWIPTSERLPEESELVLIYAESTARGGSIRVVGHIHNGFWFAQTSSDTLGLTGIGQYNVIAWQPLPEPYQPKGE